MSGIHEIAGELENQYETRMINLLQLNTKLGNNCQISQKPDKEAMN